MGISLACVHMPSDSTNEEVQKVRRWLLRSNAGGRIIANNQFVPNSKGRGSDLSSTVRSLEVIEPRIVIGRISLSAPNYWEDLRNITQKNYVAFPQWEKGNMPPTGSFRKDWYLFLIEGKSDHGIYFHLEKVSFDEMWRILSKRSFLKRSQYFS